MRCLTVDSDCVDVTFLLHIKHVYCNCSEESSKISCKDACFGAGSFEDVDSELEQDGPIRKELQNYSDLGQGRYHCHLSYKWVACWKWEKGTIVIEVYYAGSRENAPY